MPKHISAAEPAPVRVVFVTLDGHLADAARRAQTLLARDLPQLSIEVHAAAEWRNDQEALERCRAGIEAGDVIVVTMLFMEEHIQPVLPWLERRRNHCDVMVCGMSAGEVMRNTRMGSFSMSGSSRGPLALLKRLRGARKGSSGASDGARQMAMLRRLPKILRFVPGAAQDLRAYFLCLQYWLAGSDENIAGLVRFLVDRYAAGPRQSLRGKLNPPPPVEYPDVGLYHPRLPSRICESVRALPKLSREPKGTVGMLVMRAYALAGNSAHYDAVIEAFEARGLRVITSFASGLDARPAIERYFLDEQGKPQVDAVVSLTGFSLIGGPAYNDAAAAEALLSRLDVPYLAAHALEFQTLDEWESSERGLLPVEATMMVAIPELEGATGPIVFGGREAGGQTEAARERVAAADRAMAPSQDRVGMLAARVERLIALRRTPPSKRRVAVTLFNFPPGGGSVGTAAHLSVFASLHNLMRALQASGYTVDVPDTVDALRERIVAGNAARHGAQANVCAQVPVDDHVRRERWLAEIESQWGRAPGREQSDGQSLFILGARFGNVLVGVQPALGYEGDPMRLLFEKGFTPTHAFSAYYRYLREDFGADAVLHFGTHGALEFMPGKQAGLTGACWPDRLIGDLPNLYLYAANNPSEGTIAKRRAAATLISYMTPPVGQAGLYRGLLDLKDAIDRWRSLPPDSPAAERTHLAELIQELAAAVDLAAPEPVWDQASESQILELCSDVLELEQTLIPQGLHVVGEVPGAAERVELLHAMAQASGNADLPRGVIEAVAAGETPRDALLAGGLETQSEALEQCSELASHAARLSACPEIPAVLRALEGRFVPPAPGGDLLRTPDVLPTGRNLHGFDPFRIPSAFAVEDGIRQADLLLARYADDGHPFPESVALVLWGTDNLKTEGGPLAQALALMGARPRRDSYGRLCGASLISLKELGRPRVDVVMTLSGIFRDLLPLQIRTLAEASYLAASADEPPERNFIRKHALQCQASEGCDLETAALRVFSNAEGAYGSNVNHLVDGGCWEDGDELAETYSRRKCFAYGRDGRAAGRPEILQRLFAEVELTYQNLDSVELGVTTIDHYFDTLGGISRSVRRARGEDVPVYIGDQTQGDGKVRTLSEQVALETRTRVLNPKWYEGMLKHGYEGVRQIEAHVTNTMGWSATTGQVAPWVYERLSETFVLDEAMRARLAELNPVASAKVANRLIEAHDREFWSPSGEVLEALRRAGEELEDRIEGVVDGVAA